MRRLEIEEIRQACKRIEFIGMSVGSAMPPPGGKRGFVHLRIFFIFVKIHRSGLAGLLWLAQIDFITGSRRDVRGLFIRSLVGLKGMDEDLEQLTELVASQVSPDYLDDLVMGKSL